MKAPIPHLNSSSKQNITEHNLNAIIFSSKHQMYSALDKLENKSQIPNSLSHNKNPRKFSNLNILNNSHITSANDHKRASPMVYGYLQTEPQKDVAFSSGLKRSTRLNTGESEKPQRLETSFDSAYTDKRRVFSDPKRRALPVSYNTRVYTNQAVRNIPIKDFPVGRNVDENSTESRRRKIHQNIQDKRPSAPIDKNITDRSLPHIIMNNEKIVNGRIVTRKSQFNGIEKNDQESQDILSKFTNKEIISNNKLSKMPHQSNENIKLLKTTKVTPETRLLNKVEIN